ncbi:Lrp/AsnC family transcriptional regulator [Nocardia sp. PE-7]|uniref:Lrp/AsnC family transcriptional regulator n=1 Tax=Nocardia sp. PE-7 TaxID=3058426 RepID=UPI00265A3E8B|nr:Lrp/AsnC family transcriptional regulator [Nocardia sp. PE-7]WKG08058.1 Lrp/AsnC family transcriptional regulator [Nocardia sp. PE-7]
MQNSATLDELDYQLVAALQVAPRAQWQQIGRALGIDGSTAARRWTRLQSAGLAWLTCYPISIDGVSPLLAIIEIDCAPGRLHEVSAELALDVNLVTVELTTGARDLLITAVFFDHASLARYITFRLGTLDGVVTTRSQVVTTSFTEGSRWRLDRARMAHTSLLASPRRRAAGYGSIRAEDIPLVTELSRDCRQSVTTLAERTEMSPTTVRRRMARLEHDNAIAYRCEVARFISGWPLSVTFWAAAPLSHVPEIGNAIAAMRETRMCYSLTGPRNLIFNVWLRTMADMPAFEARLTDAMPELTIADRSMALWPLKIGATLLDPGGRYLRHIPIGRWEDSAASSAEAALVDILRRRSASVGTAVAP